MWYKTTYPFCYQTLYIIFSKVIRMWASFVIFVPVLVSPLPVLLEMSDEKGNQVQILNRPAAVSPSKIFEYSTSHCPPGGWEGIQRGISQKTCQDNIVLVLSGNKATKHWVEAFFIHIKESFSLFIFPWGQVTNAYKELKWDSSQDCYLHLFACFLQVVWHRIRSPYPEKS